MRDLDLHIIFPPQWSPFQPFLSLPSLKAYLEARGYAVRQSDWNVDFYEHFISASRLDSARVRLEGYVRDLSPEYEDYRNQALFALGILADYAQKRALVDRLRSRRCLENIEDFYICVTAFKRLLQAFSVAEPVVEIGISSLASFNVMTSFANIHAFCEDEDTNPFLRFFRGKVRELADTPRYFGLSVIGTEQVLPSLTLGRCLKERFPEIPVILGGSVFSRLVDKTDEVLNLFSRYFDAICRYEGERPMDALLSASDPFTERTPSLAFVDDHQVVRTALTPQLGMTEIPTPDFDDLDLKKYFTPDVVLPLLTTRGCYWDKCAFCYHGMIYGDRYRMRSPERFAADIDLLNRKYGVRHFALNDEAIPPKLFRELPKVIPKGKYFFTGLYKFEKFFRPSHYRAMYAIGFRSLYIGLETASERLQRHMRKNNTQAVMTANLRDSHEAGLWNHTFNFFGFPTETLSEAEETISFLIDHADIIHSEGTGTFSLEHNAPISKDPKAFGVTRLFAKPDRVLELYYDYEVSSGLTQKQAAQMLERLDTEKKAKSAYRYGGWIPREHLLILLSYYQRDTLLERLQALDGDALREFQRFGALSWFSLRDSQGRERFFITNSELGKIFETNRDAIICLQFLPDEAPSEFISSLFPGFDAIVGKPSGNCESATGRAAR